MASVFQVKKRAMKVIWKYMKNQPVELME